MGMIKTRQTKSGPRYDARIHRTGHGGVELTKTFKTNAEARQWMHDTESKIDRSESVSRRAETVLFSQAAAEFLHGCKSVKTNDEMLVARVNEYFNKFTIAHMNHEAIQSFIDWMLITPVPTQERTKIHPYYNGDKEKFYSPSTVRKHYFIIKKVMEWHSVKANYSLNPMLFKNHTVPASWEGKRERRLQAGEEIQLREAVKGGYAHFKEWPLLLDFALATAARAQEIIKADWTHFDIVKRTWNIPKENVKTKTFRQVPLSKSALEALAGMKPLRSKEDTRVFHMWSNTNTLSKAFRRLAVRAKMSDFKFHDLRHEAISRLFEKNKLSDAEIMKITGHTNIQTLLGYMHLRPNDLADKLD